MYKANTYFFTVLASAIVFCCSFSQGAIFQWEWSDNPYSHKQASTTLCPDGADVSAEPQANLSERNLSQAYLEYADLTGANLCIANFSNSDLSSAILIGAAFFGTNMKGTDLTNANLSEIDFGYTDFRNAKLTGANFSGAHLGDVDFRGATGVSLESAASPRNTILPDGEIVGLSSYLLGLKVVNDNIPLHIVGSPPFTQNTSINLLFDGNLWKSTISFDPNIPISIDGRLQFFFDSNVDANILVGRSFKVFDWKGNVPNGQFILGGNGVWDTSNLYTTGEVTLRAVPESETWVLAVAALVIFLFRITYLRFHRRKRQC